MGLFDGLGGECMGKKNARKVVYLFIFFYLAVNLLTLTDFPFVHSDELWLRGLTDEMLSKRSFLVTEPFYDLYPRIIHPFRWFFHFLQAGFFLCFGSSVFSARLLSLASGACALLVFHLIMEEQLESKSIAVLCTLALGLNVQFLYSSRFGRQDMLVMLFLLLNYYFAIKTTSWKKGRAAFLMSMVLLVSIGIHPNSFLIGLVTAGVLLVQVLQKKRPFRDFLMLVGITLLGVAFYLIIGYQWNPNLLSSYFQYGSSLGIDAQMTGRLEGFYWYWYKLFHRIGGTYDLFDIRIELVMLAVFLVLPLRALLKKFANPQGKDGKMFPHVALTCLVGGLLVIGRYNQTAVVFVIPFVLMMVFSLIDTLSLPWRHSRLAFLSLLAILIGVSVNLYDDLAEYLANRPYQTSYETMISEVDNLVPDDSAVLANLNLVDAFATDEFYEIRNLGYLDPSGISLQEYIAQRKIGYIILHEEMEYIHKTSPRWDFLYVNASYMEELFGYLENHTELVGEIDNPIYAMRISRYSGTYPWKTRIYKVIP